MNQSSFSSKLITWYNAFKRDLPWRKTKDAYSIWISEIILQQTRVEQGLPYYNNFLSKYPNVNLLAEASEQDVLKLWQGLGYYSRARNLHHTAKYISSELEGVFPQSHDEILKLKGIGPYTAAAIASFAFDQAFPVIDGNVIRVVARYCGIDGAVDRPDTLTHLRSQLNILFDDKQPADFNQAIMEFGALHCLPSNPDCTTCIFKSECKAYSQNLVFKIPLKSKKIVKKKRFINYAVLKKDNGLFIKKRNDKDIWKNLYDFPSMEQKQLDSYDQKAEKDLKFFLKDVKTEYLGRSDWKKQMLTHRIIHVRFWEYRVLSEQNMDHTEWILVSKTMLKKYPVPKLIAQYINDL